MKLILLAVFVSVSYITYSQSISNVTSAQQGNNALITYDLNGTTGSTYFVKLYYSTDEGQTFSGELAQVTGDVKNGVKSGTAKKIIWAADKEVNYLNGAVIFKVEAEVRKAMPKPVLVNTNSVEITNAKRSGDEVTIDFVLITNQYEKEGWSVSKKTELTGQDGKQYKAASARLGSQTEFSRDVECIKGIPVKGQVTFQVEGNDFVIPAINIVFGYGTDFIFKNIPIE